MLKLGLCYPYDSKIFWDGRYTVLNGHWILISMADKELFYNENRNDKLMNYYNYIDCLQTNNQKLNTIAKNIQIIESYVIEDTILCIIKTFWIKIFQRKYKNYYNKKINYYKNPRNLRRRQLGI